MIRTIPLGSTGVMVPDIAVGCMRLRNLSLQDAERFLGVCMEEGAVFFDHADVYGNGASEEMFAKASHLNDDLRETVFIQSKCGIRRDAHCYDFSKKHILEAVDGSLHRLNTDYLDVLLLHRPDALMEPEEVAEAFDILSSQGKVRYFGVSNQKPMQIELLKKYVRQPLVVNQLQMSITNAGMISQGLFVNTREPQAVDRDGSVLDYCRLHDITIQTWSPFQYGYFDGVFLGNDKFPELNRVIDETAARYGVDNVAVAMAWLLRHPANLQPVTGTTNPGRLRSCARAGAIRLTREEWYEIYKASGVELY